MSHPILLVLFLSIQSVLSASAQVTDALSPTGYFELTAHTDDECTASDGGRACLIWNFPSGYAEHMVVPLKFQAMFNDVRKAGSEVLQYYATVALRVQPKGAPAPRPITLFKLGTFGRNLDGGQFFTFKAAGDRPGFLWEEGVFSFDGELLWTFFHTHWQWCEEMDIFMNATAEALGLRDPDLALAQGNVVYGLDHNVIRTKLAKRAIPTCRLVRSLSAYDSLDGTAEFGKYFFRRTSACKQFTVQRGLRWVAVSFTSPVSSDVELQTAMMHISMRVLVSSNETSRPGFWNPQPDHDGVFSLELYSLNGSFTERSRGILRPPTQSQRIKIPVVN